MSERVWHKGPPPHVGWWLTKDCSPLFKNEWRYWNGQEWSIFCCEDETGSDGNLFDSHLYDPIEWTDYWPENARVPRLDPTGGHWTFNVDGMLPNHKGPIDIAMRDGEIVAAIPWDEWSWDYSWHLEGMQGDILAWRPAA